MAVAFAMRSHHFSLEARKFGEFVPFTLESAMMHSYAQEAAETGRVPKFDRRLVGMEDLAVHRQMSIGLEYFLGYGYRLKCRLFGQTPVYSADNTYEYNPDFSNWARFQIRLWISLGAGFVLVWLAALGCRWQTAALGGLLFAVAPAAVARATGQDLIMENFSIPLILSALAFHHVALRRGGWMALAVMGVSAYAAMATWDMCQLCFGLFALWELLRIMGGAVVTRRRKASLLVFIAAAYAAALTVPYLQTHRFIFSPMMSIVAPTLLALLLVHGRVNLKKAYLGIAILIGLALLWLFAWRNFGYGGAYEHFWALLKAKIRFLNVKPANPALLDFDSRMLWTPALHSASVKETLFLFGNIGLTLLVTASLLFWPWGRRAAVRELPRLGFPLFMSAVFCVLYVFMVRFHALAIPFLCVLAALAFDRLARFNPERSAPFVSLLSLLQLPALLILLGVSVDSIASGLGYALFILLGLGGSLTAFLLLVGSAIYYLRTKALSAARWPGFLVIMSLAVVTALEADWSGCLAERMGRRYAGEYLKEKAELIKWFRSEGLEEEVVLTDFTLSPMLKTYCHEWIVLQPKFELGRTRDKVKEYLDVIYNGNELSFNVFCAKNRVKYYIFDRGLVGTPHIYSSRYVANALRLHDRSPVSRFDAEPDSMRLFYRIDPPRWVSKGFPLKFTVFKVITPDDHARAVKWTKEAQQAVYNKNVEMAKRLIRSAVYADPNHEPARILHIKILGEPADIRLRGY